MTTKPSHELSISDRLSHLTFEEACKLLGPDGKRLLVRGGQLELESLEQLRIGDEVAHVDWEPGLAGGLVAWIALDAAKKGRLRVGCSRCTTSCEHVAGLLSIVLEQKTDLGLAAPPPEVTAHDDEAELLTRELAERATRAKKERMKIRSSNPSTPWTDYAVMSAISGKTYRVALRSDVRGSATYGSTDRCRRRSGRRSSRSFSPTPRRVCS